MPTTQHNKTRPTYIDLGYEQKFEPLVFQESRGVSIIVYPIQSTFLQVVQAGKEDCSTERVIASF